MHLASMASVRLSAAAIVSILLALPAAAQVHQCKDSNGKTTFSDAPCTGAQTGVLIEPKRTDEQIYRERMQAAEANERKYQQQLQEQQQRQIESQQRTIEQQAQNAAPQPLQSSQACRQARKELEFVSSIRTLSQDEKRMRTNAAITNVNASCGSNTPLMQEPDKVIVNPASRPPSR